MSFLTGGSKQTSTSSTNSSNQAYGTVAGASTPYFGSGALATNAIQRLLGLTSMAPPSQSPVYPYSQYGVQYPGNLGILGGRADVHDFSNLNAGAGINIPQYTPSGSYYGSYGAQPSIDTSPQVDPMQSWLDNSGYSWVRDQGNKGLEGTYASKSAANSGAAMKALVKFNSGLANTYLQQYLTNLQDQQKLGIGALGVLSGAGQQSSSTSTSSGKSSNGLLGGIGSLLSGIGAL